MTARIDINYKTSFATLLTNPFALLFGNFSLDVDFTFAGLVTIECTVLGVVEVTAKLEASLQLQLHLAVGDERFLGFSEWLAALTAFEDGFVEAGVTMDGEFTGSIEATYPFDFGGPALAHGGFATPYVLNFLDKRNPGTPDVEFEVTLPDLGAITELSVANILDILLVSLDFLVGSADGDSVASCSGGLLGKQILGKNVFTYEIPVLGISVCSSVRFLQTLVDAVGTIVDDESESVNGETSTSFNSLESKLSSLLQDAVGGQPKVNMTAMTDATRSDLLLDIELYWPIRESSQMKLDLETLIENAFGGSSPSAIAKFAKNVVPPEGQGVFSLDGEVSFQLGIGLEYVSGEKRVNPYILGTTGLQVAFLGRAGASFPTTYGPFRGFVSAVAEVTGANRLDEPLLFSVGLNDSLNYYLSDPGFSSANRSGYTVVSSIAGLINHVDVAFDGRIATQVAAGIEDDGLNATAQIQIAVEDLASLFRGDFSVLNVTYELDPPEFDMNTLLTVLQRLSDHFVDLETLPLLNKPLPLVGKSLNQLFSGGEDGSISQLFEFRGFVSDTTKALGRSTVTASDLQNQLALHVEGEEGRMSNGFGCQSGEQPITVEKIDKVISIEFCILLEVSRELNLDVKDLLGGSDTPLRLGTNDITVKVTPAVSFGARMEVDLDNPLEPSLEVHPLVATFDLLVDADIDIGIGVIDLTAGAQLSLNGFVAAEVCSSEMCPKGLPNADRVLPSLYLETNVQYSIGGQLSLATDVTGVNLENDASIEVVDNDALDDFPPIVNVTGFDMDLLAFTPQNAVSWVSV